MVIEHTFITTLESSAALSTASGMLQSGGFQVQNNGAFQIGAWTDLEVFRGKKNSIRAKDVTQCSQQVRLEFDRGRVTVAASITPMPRKNRSFMWGGLIGGAVVSLSQGSPKERVYGDLMIVIAQAIERLLALRMPSEEAIREWMAVEAQMREDARRARRKTTIISLSILAVIIALAVFAIVVAMR